VRNVDDAERVGAFNDKADSIRQLSQHFTCPQGGNGHCKPRKSKSMEKTPNSMLPEILTLKKLRDAGLDFQQTLVEF
jgi:hypothetical protein